MFCFVPGRYRNTSHVTLHPPTASEKGQNANATLDYALVLADLSHFNQKSLR